MTKEEKHRAYTICLRNILDGTNSFCCSSFSDNGFLKPHERAQDMFLELYNLRTIQVYVWFRSRSERIEALKKCIELTKS